MMSMTCINVMMDLAKFGRWSGDASDLARLAGEILAARGHADASSGPNVRVLRDYAQRGIVSRAERQGKEAIYGYRQLLEFVAARLLVADGWPLAKIAEHFAHIADAELHHLISGDGGSTRALAVAQRLRSEAELASRPRRDPGHSSRSEYRRLAADHILAESTDDFRARAARLSGIQSEMRDALRRLGLPEDGPAIEQLTLLAIAPWCQVLVESSRLTRLTIEEAEEIGRAVTASLLTATRKGSKR
jgi:hypothetical protein